MKHDLGNQSPKVGFLIIKKILIRKSTLGTRNLISRGLCSGGLWRLPAATVSLYTHPYSGLPSDSFPDGESRPAFK